MKLVLVEWHDATGGVRGGWKSVAELVKDKARQCRSVGWLAHEDNACVVIVPHTTDDGDGDGEITIPRDWCQRIVDLVEKPKGRRK